MSGARPKSPPNREGWGAIPAAVRISTHAQKLGATNYQVVSRKKFGEVAT
jgi:hypothetical protein